MSKNTKITVSEKYGVNPSMDRCFFCGEVKGIVMLGKLPGDVEAPKFIMSDYEPCDKCKEQFAQGITCIEVTDHPVAEGQPPIKDNHYPTSRLSVITEEASNRLFGDSGENFKDLKKGNVLFVDSQVYEQIFGDLEHKQAQEIQEK